MTVANLLARELANGMWFIMSASIWCILGLSLLGRIRLLTAEIEERGKMRRLVANLRELVHDVREDRSVGLQAGIAFWIWMTADVIRSGYVWSLFISEGVRNNLTPSGVATALEANYWIIYVAVAFALVGGMCCVRIFSRDTLSAWTARCTWVLVGAAGIIVPVAVYLWTG